MNHQIKVRSEPTVSAQLGSTPPSATVPDSDTQAVADIGELAFLAASYESLVAEYGASSALAQEALKEFQTLYGYYHINGNTATFDYNEGAQPGTPITDPEALEILQHLPVLSNPPTGADVGNFLKNFWYTTATIHWSDGKDQSIQQRILEFFIDTKFTMANNMGNTTTNTAMLLFYCSLANVPASQIGGTLDKFFLSIGYKNGAMIDLGNIYAITLALCTHLRDDSFLNPDVIAAGLSIQTKDPLYQKLGLYFSSVYKSWIQQNPVDENAAWQWESRFLPYYYLPETARVINALPGSDNTQLANRLEVDRQFREEREASRHAAPHKKEELS